MVVGCRIATLLSSEGLSSTMSRFGLKFLGQHRGGGNAILQKQPRYSDSSRALLTQDGSSSGVILLGLERDHGQ